MTRRSLLYACLLLAACAGTPDRLEDPTPLYEEAVALFRAGDLDASLEKARAALAEDAGAIRPRWLVATILLRQDEWQQSVEELRILAEQHPTLLVAPNRMGEILARRGLTEEARRCFEHVLENLDPDWVPALVNLGALHLEEGRPEEALPLLERAVARAPDDWTARLQLSAALRALEREEEARAQLRVVLEADDLPEDRRRAIEALLDEGE